MRRQLADLLFSVARSRIGETIARFGFARLPGALPVQRLAETERVIAFYHPRPSYPVHVLLVPKRAVKSLMHLRADELAITADVVTLAQRLVRELGLQGGYRLIVNGGRFQDVGQLHFHLIGDHVRSVGTR